MKIKIKLKESFALIIVTCFLSEAQSVTFCGQRNAVIGTIFGGEEVSRNAWPWLVAFHNRLKKKFFCAGSLITEKHVLSASHCFQNKGQKRKTPPEYVLAQLGKHDLNVTSEFGSWQSLVWSIVLHPDWNFNEEKFDADIAMIVMTNAVDFSRQIQPVCLPPFSYDEVGGVGVVVGWGKSENSGRNFHETKPNQLVVPAVNASHCYTTFHVLGSVSSNRAFCGGYDSEGRAPCLGDSGGGFYFRDKTSNLWNIRGIVSAALIDFDYGCDINKYSIYTNVARFVDWISSVVKDTRNIRWIFVEFNCTKIADDLEFEVDANCYHSYTGPITRTLRINPNFASHSKIKNAADVKSLVMYFGASKRMFAGIGAAFQNLEVLWIEDNSLTLLERSNFVRLSKLKRLEMPEQQIEFIEEETFWDLQSLSHLNLYRCGISELPSRVFAYLRNLVHVVLSFNRLTHLPRDLFKDNSLIFHIDLRSNQLKLIDVDFTRFTKLSELYLNLNDCIDASYATKFGLYSTVSSLQELQGIVNRDCKTLRARWNHD